MRETFAAQTALSLLVLKPVLVSLVGLWLLDHLRYQSARLRKYATVTVFLCVAVIPLAGLLTPPVALPLLPAYSSWMAFQETYLTFTPDLLVYLLCFNAVVALYLLIRLAVDIWAVARVTRSAAVFAVPDWLQMRLNECGKVRIRIGAIGSSPVVWGAIRPTILLPENFPELHRQIQEQMIEHELTHIQQRDWLLLMLVQFCCCVFWYIPWIWTLQKKMYEVMENVCDDSVLSRGHQPHSYAETLVGVMKGRHWQRVVLNFSEKSFLFRRIETILDCYVSREIPSRCLKAWITLLSVCLVCFLASAQLTTFAVPRADLDNKLMPLQLVEINKRANDTLYGLPEISSRLEQLKIMAGVYPGEGDGKSRFRKGENIVLPEFQQNTVEKIRLLDVSKFHIERNFLQAP